MEDILRGIAKEINHREPLEETHPVEGPEKIPLTCDEIDTAIEKMKYNEAQGPSGMTAEMFKALEHD